MSKVLVTDTHLEDIADAIRGKLGVQTTYRPGDMAAAIESISGGGYPEPTGTISITQNGTVNVKDYASANVNVQGGGGAVIKTLLYQINESQGGRWINTEVDVSQIDTLMFEDVRSDVIQKYTVIDVANIAVYTGGADVYTMVYTQTRPFNVRIYNNYLYVSYNGSGPSTNVTKVYDYAERNINLQAKTVTQNGTVTPDSGYDGLSSVVVNVQ